MNRVRATLVALLMAVLVAPVAADPLQDRLDRIAEEMTELSTAAINGTIDADEAARQMERLFMLDFELRTGARSLDDLTLRWQDQGDQPLKAPGAGLVAVGLPPDFAGPVYGLLDDGTRIDVIAEGVESDPYAANIIVPDHPDGDAGTGTLTIQFADAGSLRVQMAPRLDIPDALPVLMRLAMNDLVTALEADGVNPEALLAQFRRDSTAVPPEQGYAAAALYIWSEAGRGDPVFGFMRTGQLDGPFWESLGNLPDPAALNRLYSGMLQNSGALEKLMRLQQGRIDKIRFVPPDPTLRRNLHRTKTAPGPTTPPQQVSLREISELLTIGRGRQYNREVVLKSAKNAQKVLDYASFEPVTMTAAGLVGGVLTMSEKYMKTQDYHYPVTLSIEGNPFPPDPLLADDDRLVFPDIEIVAKGEPYEYKVFSDGLDATLAALDLASNFGKVGKAVKTFGKAKETLTDGQKLLKAREQVEDVLVSRATAATKNGLEAVEKAGDAREKGSFNIVTVPARTWTALVTADTYSNYVSIGYNGETAWDVTQFHTLACWKNTGEGIRGTITTKSDAFAGLFGRLDLEWGVQTPKVALTVEPERIPPGGSASVTAITSGAQQTRVDFASPSVGGLSSVGDFDAVYGAPPKIENCQEFVPITATFPPPGARICAPPPKATAGIIIAKGDGLIRTPRTLTCRDGEVLGFTVAHADGTDVQCRLNGPGRLTMVGNEGLLDCPVKPRRPSSITCFTGRQAGQCAPVIPIKRIYPDYAVYAQVSAQRTHGDKLNDEVDPFFDDCGIENPTALVLELMDLGTGAADALNVDPVFNNCPSASMASLGGGGGVSGDSGGGAPSIPEGKAEGRYVAVWPLGEGRDVEVSDFHSYYDPPAGWQNWQFYDGNIEASITFNGPEAFSVRTDGRTTVQVGDAEPDTPDSGYAEWSVWRRIVVNRDTAVTATVDTSGPALHLVQVAPMRLENNVPVSLLFGFDQNRTPAMMVGKTDGIGLFTPRSATSTVVLPGPRGDRGSLTYLIRFGGRVTPSEVSPKEVTAASSVRVSFDIEAVR